LIDAIPRLAGSPFVFTTTGNTPISGWSRAKKNIDKIMGAQLDDSKPWRIHDLRRTAATGMERLGIKQQVVEALLGHIAGSKAGVTGIYQRHTYEQEKREAIEKWAEHIASLVRRAE
jgi:integrase